VLVKASKGTVIEADPAAMFTVEELCRLESDVKLQGSFTVIVNISVVVTVV
jgi:hypothetical protein